MHKSPLVSRVRIRILQIDAEPTVNNYHVSSLQMSSCLRVHISEYNGQTFSFSWFFNNFFERFIALNCIRKKLNYHTKERMVGNIAYLAYFLLPEAIYQWYYIIHHFNDLITIYQLFNLMELKVDVCFYLQYKQMILNEKFCYFLKLKIFYF